MEYFMNTKKCTICNEVKDISLFYKKLNGVTHRCNSCEKEYQQQYYITNRDKRIATAKHHAKKTIESNRKLVIDFLKNNPCIDCGETDILVLQFDHRENKKFNVSSMLSYGHRPPSTKKILEEISKCDIRCANCHQRKTAHSFGYWKIQYLNS